jgi:putative membrane protein
MEKATVKAINCGFLIKKAFLGSEYKLFIWLSYLYGNLKIMEVTRLRGGLVGLIVRFIVSALVLMLVSFLLPGFALLTFGQALIAAVVIAVLGFVVESLFGKRISPQNRGIVGFLTAAVVIYISQFVVPGMTISILGALLAAVIIGVVDLFVPTELR